MYTQQLRDIYAFEKPDTENPPPEFEDGVYVTHLYILANRLICPELVQPALDMAIDHFNTFGPSFAAIHLAFDNLPEHDIFLQAMVNDYCNWSCEDKLATEDALDLPQEFLLRVTRKSISMSMHKEEHLKHEDYKACGSGSREFEFI